MERVQRYAHTYNIVPVDLKKKPEKLAELKNKLGLPSDFEIESFENWRPSHPHCNRTKSDTPYDAPIVGIEIISNAAAAKKAEKIAGQVVGNKKLEKNIAAVLSALETNSARGEQLAELKEALNQYSEFHEKKRVEDQRSTPINLGFGYLIADGSLRVVKQRYGVGVGPSGSNIPYHMRCSNCGNPYFNGARCTNCGHLDDF